jgi:hypothetical protein
MSGADAWVARDTPPAGGVAAGAVLYSEVGVGGACGATSSTAPQELPCSRKPARDREPLEREAAPDAARSAAEGHWRRFPRRAPQAHDEFAGYFHASAVKRASTASVSASDATTRRRP